MAALLLDAVCWLILAALALVMVYLVFRVGTMAVLQSIEDFHRNRKAKPLNQEK